MANQIKVTETATSIEFELDGKRTKLNKASLSPEVKEAGLWYGVTVKIQRGAALPKGSTDLARFAGMQRIVDAFNNGTKTWNIKETPEEKAAREAATAKADLFEALGRIGYDAAKATIMLANFGKKKGWGEAQAVLALSSQAEVAKMLLTIKQERLLERAGPAPEIDLNELFG